MGAGADSQLDHASVVRNGQRRRPPFRTASTLQGCSASRARPPGAEHHIPARPPPTCACCSRPPAASLALLEAAAAEVDKYQRSTEPSSAPLATTRRPACGGRDMARGDVKGELGRGRRRRCCRWRRHAQCTCATFVAPTAASDRLTSELVGLGQAGDCWNACTDSPHALHCAIAATDDPNVSCPGLSDHLATRGY